MQPSAAARARPQLGPVAAFLRTLTELLLELGPAKDAFQTRQCINLHKLLVLNAGTCMLYLLGRLLQESLLGPLREMEAMKAGDRIRSYALNKMVFIGAILQDHDEKEMMVWFVWLALVGFVRQLGLLVRDRLEYITLAVHTKKMDLAKIGVLLAILLIVNTFLLALCLRVAGCRPSECDVNTVGLLMLLLFEAADPAAAAFFACAVCGAKCIALAKDPHSRASAPNSVAR